jgi:hypothetical protein
MTNYIGLTLFSPQGEKIEIVSYLEQFNMYQAKQTNAKGITTTPLLSESDILDLIERQDAIKHSMNLVEEWKYQEEKELQQAEQDFKEGKKIDNESFLKLLDKYNIKTPSRTRGWIINSLRQIDKDHCSYTGNLSKNVFKLADQLYEKIS